MSNFLAVKISKIHFFIDKYNGNGFFSDFCDVFFTFFYSYIGFKCELKYFKGKYF